LRRKDEGSSMNEPLILIPEQKVKVKETVFRKGMKKYVRMRTRSVRFRKQTGTSMPHSRDFTPNMLHREASAIAPSIRYPVPTLTLIDLPTLILEIPDFDFEPWLLELWNDFLIEPTPYLVVSAMIYIGLLLLVSHYYDALWRVISLWFYFLPWDDEWVLGYR
jgi:hypothetical protein